MSVKAGVVVAWLAKHKDKKRWPLYIGIDPGGSGAIAFVNPTGHLVFDMPTFKTAVKGGGKRKNRTDYDLPKIVDLFMGLQGFRGNVQACVEIAVPNLFIKGGTGKGKSAYAAYRVGMGYYMWPLFLLSKGFVVHEATPGSWKSKAKLMGKGKDVSLRKARKRFPDAELHLKKHEGRAEALLLARHAMLLHTIEKEK